MRRTQQGRPKDMEKRENIIQAAGELFMAKGYEGTSMNEVAQQAGVSKLTIYSHFADKAQLFTAVIQQRCDAHIMPASFMALASRPVREALVQIGQNFAQVVFNPCSIELHRIMQAESGRSPEIVQLFYEAGPKRVRQAFVELLSVWCEEGKLFITDIPKAAEQFFSLLKGEMHMKRLLGMASLPDDIEIKTHVEASVTMFLAAYENPSKDIK